jgi:hypothetical protein
MTVIQSEGRAAAKDVVTVEEDTMGGGRVAIEETIVMFLVFCLYCPCFNVKEGVL